MSEKRPSDTNEQTRAMVHIPRPARGRRADTVYVTVADVAKADRGCSSRDRYAAKYQQGSRGSISEVPAIVVNVTR